MKYLVTVKILGKKFDFNVEASSYPDATNKAREMTLKTFSILSIDLVETPDEKLSNDPQVNALAEMLGIKI